MSLTCVQFVLFDVLELTNPLQTQLAIHTRMVIVDTQTMIMDVH